MVQEEWDAEDMEHLAWQIRNRDRLRAERKRVLAGERGIPASELRAEAEAEIREKLAYSAREDILDETAKIDIMSYLLQAGALAEVCDENGDYRYVLVKHDETETQENHGMTRAELCNTAQVQLTYDINDQKP